jgi:hypothetical protein
MQCLIHNARSHSIPCFIRATLSYNHYKNIQHNEHKRETDSFEAIGIQDAAVAISEAERLLAGRRSSLPTVRLSTFQIPTWRRSTLAGGRRRVSTLDIDLNDLKHLN